MITLSRRSAEPQEAAAVDRGSDTSVVILAVVAVVVLVAAAFFGVSWLVAHNDRGLQTAQTRDVVLEAGKHGLVQMNTLDYRQADAGLERWQQQVTGALGEEVAKNRADNVRSIQAAKTVTNARVLNAAVTRLDLDKGEANVIAALEVTVTPDGAPGATKRSRIDATLTKTDDGWKLSAVQVVGLSG
jgi:Mce-associated membrane protein